MIRLHRASRTGQAQEFILGHSSDPTQARIRVLFSYEKPVAVELTKTLYVLRNPPSDTTERHIENFVETTDREVVELDNDLVEKLADSLFIGTGCQDEVRRLLSDPGEATAPDPKKASPGQGEEAGPLLLKDIYRIFYPETDKCED